MEVSHIGVTVPDLEDAITEYAQKGFHLTICKDKPSLSLSLAMMWSGEIILELIAPYGTGLKTELHQPGTFHIAVEVENLQEAYDHLRLREEKEFIKELVEKGRYFYKDPNYLVELVQKK